MFCSVLKDVYMLNIFNTGKISTEQSTIWATVTRNAQLFIAVNVSYKT